MTIKLFDHQLAAVEKLRTGSILFGGVGSGKSLTAIAYFFMKECDGEISKTPDGFCGVRSPKDLYIITTAAKRDTLDWERECSAFMITRTREGSIGGIKVEIDSWNNIEKYVNIRDSFFIFDEQRVVGSGSWVKSFLKITKSNNWILLSATPGDTWSDYIPVFIANGFYKNRTEFIRTHVVYNTFTKYPKIDRYVDTERLKRQKDLITVRMLYEKRTKVHNETLKPEYNKILLDSVSKERWNPYENKPIKDISQYCYVMRKVVNSDRSRLLLIKDLIRKHQKLIVFYNFNYELEILRELKKEEELEVAEHNGHRHEPIPKKEKWVYLVQYMSGAEGWNCIETNAIAFYSQTYSYRMMAQAAGRIDRLNTPFLNLYYYTFCSDSVIDKAIQKALASKQDFNELLFSKNFQKKE